METRVKKIHFALDYDETFTADPQFFSDFIAKAKVAGHAVYLVTARRDTEENWEQIDADLTHWGCQVPIIFTSLESKLTACHRRGLKVDIWIDDDPKSLVNGR